MTDNPAAFECKKDRLAQTQDGVWKLTVSVHPNDMPDWLLRAPMGQRIGAAALVALDDNEGEPISDKPAKVHQGKREFHQLPYSQQAGILCGDEKFQRFMRERKGWNGAKNEAGTAFSVYGECGIGSRAELDTDDEAAACWQALMDEYVEWQQGGRR